MEAVRKSEATVSLKAKTRSIFIVRDLQKKLLRYIAEQKITTGIVFITRTGKPMSRTNIWREMKNLCIEAEANPEKVFPHNLRHLLARVIYGIEKDIAKLADISDTAASIRQESILSRPAQNTVSVWKICG